MLNGKFHFFLKTIQVKNLGERDAINCLGYSKSELKGFIQIQGDGIKMGFT